MRSKRIEIYKKVVPILQMSVHDDLIFFIVIEIWNFSGEGNLLKVQIPNLICIGTYKGSKAIILDRVGKDLGGTDVQIFLRASLTIDLGLFRMYECITD